MTRRRTLRELTIDEISGVTLPANAEALVLIMKRRDCLGDVADHLEAMLGRITTRSEALVLKGVCRDVLDHRIANAPDEGALYASEAFNRIYAVMGAAETRG